MSATTTVILGGGFGGIAAANSLRRLLPADHEIVVIDASARFHVGAGKTWVMLGERTYDQISQSRSLLFARGIRVVEAEVQSISLSERTVSARAESLKWDFLVVALGAELNMAAVPGLAEAAHTFYTVEGAERLKTVLERFSGGDVAILIPKAPFKCPPAPYEAAMLLHEAFRRRGLAGKARLAIHTVEGAPMTTAGAEMGEFIKSELAQRGIAFFPQRSITQVHVPARRILFESGGEAHYDLLIAVPPHVAPKVVRDAQLVNQSGWIPVDPKTMQVKQPADASAVYAAGDVTVVPLPGRYKPEVGLALPKAGVFAEAHGRVAAHQIAARILGRAPTEAFDGKGYCFLETGDKRAVKADGSFFELPHPVMQKRAPDEAQLSDKHEWVEGLLRPLR
ncbi:MAG TPA: FAD/NAD(P)-binding oxidoreductase [Burkholderiales bacterium]|nr:FAD/NAD(P)-binding oxidoreductase [Burkholderiales bacterium]